MKHRAILEIDLRLLKKNCSVLKKITRDVFFCPMIKTDAYGHGAVQVAQALYDIGIKQVGVISAEEAWAIREFVKDMDILIFGPVLNSEDLSWIVEEQLILVCNNWQDSKSLSAFKKPLRIHLKFDTGFSRLGFNVSEAKKIYDFLKDNFHIQVEGIASQLVSGEELGNEKSFSTHQIQQFKELTKIFPLKNFHILNTSALTAVFIHKEQMIWGTRPGIGLYGIKPKVFLKNQEAQKRWDDLSLTPVSCLKSHIVALHQLKTGNPVSYGGNWKASRPSCIATVSLGYGDGFLRSLGSSRYVLLRGKKCPIVGDVCMDFFMIDVTDIKNKKSEPIQIDEEVLIFGNQKDTFLPLQTQAEQSGTTAYEFLSRLGPRVERIYKT